MRANVIAVLSPKGGVGKTTTSVNLTAAIASLGKKVLIVDANLETPHVAVYFGFDGFSTSLEDVVNSREHVRAAIYKTDNPNIDILPSKVFKSRGDGYAKYNLINLFYHLKQLENEYDFIILDSKPSYDIEFLKMIKDVKAIIVSAPEIASALEAKKLYSALSEANVSILGVVLNKFNARVKSMLNKEQIGNMRGFKKVWVIPEDNSVYDALMEGKPVLFTNPKGRASKAFLGVAKDLISYYSK